MANRKVKRIQKPIISGYLERINAQVFDKYKGEITEMIKGRQGLYALYRRNKLYYVGLARNLKSRISQHLRDRHQGKWTHFSMYVIRKTDHVKELESMLLRIAYPEGNSVRGKLSKADDLLPKLIDLVKRHQEEERKRLLGGRRGGTRQTRKLNAAAKAWKTRMAKHKPLKGLFSKRTRIYAPYKGETFRATVFTSGTIRFDGELYDSPSAAGKAVRKGKATNGWTFWKMRNGAGQLVPLATLR